MKGLQHTFLLSISVLFSMLFSTSIKAQEVKDSLPEWDINYGKKGIEFGTTDGKYKLQFQGRLQFRYANPGDRDPVNFNDFGDYHNSVFKINRARLKIGGNVYQPWLKYYWEYDFPSNNLLDFRLMIEKWKWMSFKIGQWKQEYSRERRISSGSQQMVDRSILNRYFTIDRQQGVEVYGRLDGKQMADFSYWFSATTGTGRGASTNDDNRLMYFGRLQWNVLGEDLGFTSSDLKLHKKPELNIALSGVTNRSRFTRFSSSGGGEIAGFEDAEAGQYRINQFGVDAFFVYNGFSFQSEYHNKRIIDKVNNDQRTRLSGYYLQAGLLGHQQLSWWPKPLEVAARYSRYTPDNRLHDNFLHEESLAFNWYFVGHKNKLTFEVSNFDYENRENNVDNQLRFRLQWDVSF